MFSTNTNSSILLKLISLPLLYTLITQLMNFPSFEFPLIVALTIYTIALSYWSKLWLIILPTILPVLDLTPWSGRILITEFDLFVLSSIVVSLFFNRLDFSFLKNIGAIKWLILLLTISYGISTLIGYFSLKEIHNTEFHIYLTEYNSLRIAKGFFAALVFLPILAHEKKIGTPIAKILSSGIIIGLILAITSIIWERLILPGFFDFSNTYRISGLFSGMLLGGAMIDGYLLLSFPFFFVLFYNSNKPWLHLLGILIFTFGLYSILVTFTRTNYLAASIVILILAIGDFFIRNQSATYKIIKHPIFFYIVISVITLFVVASIFKGSFIGQRFSTTITSFEHRLEHWSNANHLKNNGISSFLLGDGKGTYPNSYFNKNTSGLTMARFWLQEDISTNAIHKNFVRFSPSDSNGTLNIIQRFSTNQIGTYQAKITLRNYSRKPQKLLVEFCNKNILAFKSECLWRGFTVKNNNSWQTVTQSFTSSALNKGLLSSATPTDINILNRGLDSRLDIAKIQIIAPNGQQILYNTEFNNGFDHWYFSSGNHMAWHIKNLWVSAFFEGGLIEVTLISLLLISIANRLYQQVQQGNHTALAILAGISGMVIVGLFGSIFDEPRIIWFFFIIAWLAILKPEKEIVHTKTEGLWITSAVVITVILSTAIAVGLYVIDKLDYTVEDVSTKFVEEAAEKLDIDTKGNYQAHLNFPPIKQWQGQGANTLYSQITTKYDFLKKPLAISENTEKTRFVRRISVRNSKQLILAIRNAQPGDGIELQSGIYSLRSNIGINKNGSTYQPIVLYTKYLGNVLIEFNAQEGFKVNATNWTFQNLIIKGDCNSHSYCEHAFHLIGKADGTIIRNNIIYDFNSAIKSNGTPLKNGTLIYPDNVLIEKNSFTNTKPRNTTSAVTTVDVVGGDNFRIKANLISNFIKLHSDKTSYAAFLKGYGKKGIIEENLVICNMNIYKKGHTQVGLSLGGGGTGSAFCFDKKCEYEHNQGVIKNNIIMNCNDVGIYINKGKDTKILNNTLYNTAGIDIRFPQSNALVENNLLNGKIRTRNKAILINKHNLIIESLNEFNNWFSNPSFADFSPLEKSTNPLPLYNSSHKRDYCSTTPPNQPRSIGATSNYSQNKECSKLLKNQLPVLLSQFNEDANQSIKQLEKQRHLFNKEAKLKQEITLCYSCKFIDLDKALKATKTNGTVYIEAGSYETCGYINRPVRIIGKPALNRKVHLTRRACNYKAALVINAANVTIENIEISNIQVKDNNGACIRAEGNTSNLRIKNVYCHDSQAGIIANLNQGKMIIRDSIFERNGFSAGSVHNVNLNSKGSIEIFDTKILSTQGLGHLLHINAPYMLIENSEIAALDAHNSRAINNTTGGELIIKNSIIQQGVNSDNNEIIAFGLTVKEDAKVKQKIILDNNQIIFEKPGSLLSWVFNRKVIFKTSDSTKITLKNNIITGIDSYGSGNIIVNINNSM